MTGYQSKRAAAQDKLVVTDIDGHVVRDARKPKKAMALDKLKCQCSMTTKLVGSGCQYCNPEYWDDDDDTQVYKDHGDALTIAYQSGYYDGKKAALAGREWNFCERCGKRTADLTVIHTCTPPQRKPLTDEEHDQLMRGRSTLHYGRAVEAAHGIKE